MREEIATAQRIGVTGVPCYIIDGRYAVMGAQEPEAIVAALREAAATVGLPEDAVQLVGGESHEDVKQLMRARGLVDVLIPRGGANLIRSVVEESTVPVIETGVGNCHVYVDAAADLGMALEILLNA